MESPQVHHGVSRIVAGGQTGVDRGALEAALALGIPHGGWCPKGRLAEDGCIPAKFQLQEMPTSDYALRTEQNVIDSDGTLILYRERLQGGTLLTHRLAKRHQRPVCRIRLDRSVHYHRIVEWLTVHSIGVLNVAGPRGSHFPGIEAEATRLIMQLFRYAPPLPLED